VRLTRFACTVAFVDANLTLLVAKFAAILLQAPLSGYDSKTTPLHLQQLT
jgi:hypothetical protein